MLPHTPRERAAYGVCFSPSARINSATPSIVRSQTLRVASGVTSRGEIPVPPVVTTNRAWVAAVRNAAAICWASSGSILVRAISNPASLRHCCSRGPERSSRVPRWEESLMIRTAAVSVTRRARSPRRRDWLHRASANLPSASPAWTEWWSVPSYCR